MKHLIELIFISLLLSFGVALQAQEGQQANTNINGASLYIAKGCGHCHGADGNSPIMSLYPKVAGQNTVYTFNQLKDFKAGKRKNAMAELMRGMVVLLTDDELQQLAEYLSGGQENEVVLTGEKTSNQEQASDQKQVSSAKTVESSANQEVPSAAVLIEATPSGKAGSEVSIYSAKGCVACHGADGNTPLLPNYPNIAGQNAVYTLNQLKDFKAGTRKNAMADLMKGIVAPLTEDEMQQLADYLSGDQTANEVDKTSEVPYLVPNPERVVDKTISDKTVLVTQSSTDTNKPSIFSSKGCTACHGTDGNTPIAPNYPKIAGQNVSYIINQMNAFKTGTRKNGMATIMKGIVAPLSDDDIQELAVYLSKNPAQVDISGTWPSCKAWCVGGMTGQVDEGNWEPCKQWCEKGMPNIPGVVATAYDPLLITDRDTLYYKKACIACHGEKGNKPVMDDYPKIAGQTESYLLTQMKDIKTSLRNNNHSIAMTNIMDNVTDEEMASLAKWLSGQSQ